MSNDYTEEELAALPQTETVFEPQQLVFDDHKWLQQGYHLTDVCSPQTAACHTGGIPIPNGKMLVKQGEKYALVNEMR
jgi:hypothetical protein